MNRTFKYLSYFTVIVGTITLLYTFYLVIFPLKAVDSVQQPYEVITKQVRAGDTFKYRAELCKYVDSPGIITRQLIGEESIFINTEPSNFPKGCGSSTRSVMLPRDISPGTYHLVITLDYHVNILHTISARFVTEDFEIIK